MTRNDFIAALLIVPQVGHYTDRGSNGNVWHIFEVGTGERLHIIEFGIEGNSVDAMLHDNTRVAFPAFARPPKRQRYEDNEVDWEAALQQIIEYLETHNDS